MRETMIKPCIYTELCVETAFLQVFATLCQWYTSILKGIEGRLNSWEFLGRPLHTGIRYVTKERILRSGPKA